MSHRSGLPGHGRAARLRLAFVALTAVSVALPGPGAGQSSPDEAGPGAQAVRPASDALARALEEREAADRAWFAASARRAAARRTLAGAAATIDPAFSDVGPFRVIASPERIEEATAAVEAAWRRYAPLVGRPDVYIGSRPLLVEWQGDPVVRVASAGPGAEPIRLGVSRWRGRKGVFNAVDEHFSAQLGRSLELPGFTGADRERLYRTLLTDRSGVVTECMAGDAASCWAALGVAPLRPAWRAWIRPEEYVDAVARLRGGGSVRDLAAAERCLSLGEPTVCEAVLVGVGEQPVRATTPPPLQDAQFRMDLAYFAALRGGAGAYERLQPTLGGDFRDRVGAAAQADPDTVVLAWIEEVLSGGVDRSDGSRRRRSAALLWYVLLAIPAARSSRWRLD